MRWLRTFLKETFKMSLFLEDLTKERLETLGRALQPPVELDKREKREDLEAQIRAHVHKNPQVREAERNMIAAIEVGSIWQELVGEGETLFALNWTVSALDLAKQHIHLLFRAASEDEPEVSEEELAAEIVSVARVSIPGIRPKGLRDLGGMLSGEFSQDEMHVLAQGTTFLISAPRGRAREVQDQVLELLRDRFGYHDPERYITRQS